MAPEPNPYFQRFSSSSRAAAVAPPAGPPLERPSPHQHRPPSSAPNPSFAARVAPPPSPRLLRRQPSRGVTACCVRRRPTIASCTATLHKGKEGLPHPIAAAWHTATPCKGPPHPLVARPGRLRDHRGLPLSDWSPLCHSTCLSRAGRQQQWQGDGEGRGGRGRFCVSSETGAAPRPRPRRSRRPP